MQGFPHSSKVMVFSKTIFQAWKVMGNNTGHGTSWEMIVKLWNFYNYLHKLLMAM